MNETTSLVDLPLSTFLKELADRTPTPGGGSAAGACGALACALGAMVASFRIGPKTPGADRAIAEDILRHLTHAGRIMQGLIDEDAQAYANYTACMSEKGSKADSAARLETATAIALVVPMQICATAGEVLENLEQLVPVAGVRMLSDLGAAAILAEATVRCAACTIRVNIPNVRDQASADGAEATLEQIEQTASRRLNTIGQAAESRVQDRRRSSR